MKYSFILYHAISYYIRPISIYLFEKDENKKMFDNMLYKTFTRLLVYSGYTVYA